MPNLLICTVGLPRSGKSTWARQQCNRFPVVNRDSIRFAMHGQAFILEAEPWIDVMVRTMVKALFRAGHKVVILDETNYRKEARSSWKRFGCDVVFKYFDTPMEECIRRAETDGSLPELASVIKRMNSWFDSLDENETIFEEEILKKYIDE